MATTTSSSSSLGIGFPGLLTIILVVLKALGYISVSWFVCFLPIIISFSLAIFILLAIAVVAAFVK